MEADNDNKSAKKHVERVKPKLTNYFLNYLLKVDVQQKPPSPMPSTSTGESDQTNFKPVINMMDPVFNSEVGVQLF